MNKKTAINLVQQYMSGWKQNDLSMILSCLDEKCQIIESHGPIYFGIQDVRRWFHYWLEAKSKITKWDLLSLYYCESENTAFVEWNFLCVSNGIEYELPGISMIKFTELKIYFIHEYRMTRPMYKWSGETLNSD